MGNDKGPQPEAAEDKSLSDPSRLGSRTILDKWSRLALTAIPLVLAGLELSHPSHVSHHVATSFFPVAGWWLTLHIIQFGLIAGLGGSVFLLTAGCRGIAAVTSRVSAIVFVIFYDLGDAVIGVAAGVLGHHAGDLPASLQAGRVEAITVIFNDPVINDIYTVGRIAWLVTMLSAAVVVLIHRHKPLPAICIVLSGVILSVFDHPGLPGSSAFLLLFIAGVAFRARNSSKPVLDVLR